MLRVTTYDYNFYQMVAFIQQPTADTTRLVKSIQLFRSRLSLKWFEQFADDDPIECLTAVWLTLLKLSTHDDATVRISVYNAIGGLLFALLPFSPIVIMRSFSNAIQQHKVTSRASIAIISSFLYICHSISPSDLDNFITAAPVIHHFGVDVSNFIQHIPKFIPLMAPLDLQFHQLLLRSLLSSFGRNPNHDFVKSVVLLVDLNPQTLIKDLMEFTISNKLDQTILAMGPQILRSDKIYPLLSDEYLNTFENAALEVLAKTDNTLSVFEQACGTLSILVDRYEGQKLEEIKNKINEKTLDDYPKHFQKLLYLLPTSLENLKILPTDNNSIKCAKINALVNYSHKTQDKRPVLEVIFNLIMHEKIEGDVLTAIVNALASIFNILLGIDDKMLGDAIEHLLNYKGSTSWLQKTSFVKLLSIIGSDLGNKLIPNFEDIVIPLILEFTCSPQDELSELAIQTLTEFVTLKNLDNIKKFLWSVNYFDSQTALNFVKLLNVIAETLGVYCVEDFASIVSELIIFHPNESEIAGNAFKFITKCNFFTNIPNDVISSCIDWITRLYQSVTQNNSRISSPLKNEPLPPLISTVETDVVASDILNSQSRTLPLLYCYKYYVSLKGISSPFCVSFTCELIKLFPDKILPLTMKIPKAQIVEFEGIQMTVLAILKAESSLKTATFCCDFLNRFSSTDTQKRMLETVKFFINNPKVVNGEYLAHFYKYVINLCPKEKDTFLKTIKDRLDPVNLAIFDIENENFTTENFKEMQSKVRFANWPAKLCDFFKENNELKAEIEDLNELDFDHFAFYYRNKEQFINVQNYDDYITHHHHFIEKLVTQPVNKVFQFKPIPEDTIKISSILPQIIDGNISTFSDSLILSFFQFTNYSISNEMFDKIFDLISSPKAALFALKYAKRNHFTILESKLIDLLSKFQSNSNDPSFTEFKNEISKLVSEKYLDQLPEYKSFIAPNQYLKDIQNSFENNEPLKSKMLLEFCKTLSNEPKFDPMIISNILVSILERLENIESSKKILSALRAISECLYLYGKKFSKETLSDIERLLQPTQNSDISLVFYELSYIFNFILNLQESNQLFTFCENFDKLVKQYSIFIVPQSSAVSLYGKVSTRVNKNGINDRLLSEIPSQKLKSIRAIDKLVNSRPCWQIIIAILPNIIKIFQECYMKPFFDSAISNLSMVLATDINFESIKQNFVQKILPILFAAPNTPHFKVFAEAVSVVTQKIPPPLPGYFKYIDCIMESTPIEPNAAHYYRDFVRWLLKHEHDPVRKSDILLEELSKIQIIFSADPSNENSDGLIEALKSPVEGIDSSFMMLGKLAMLKINKLQIAVLIHKYLRCINSEGKENCKAIFESLSDSYDPELKIALNYVLNGKSIEVAKL